MVEKTPDKKDKYIEDFGKIAKKAQEKMKNGLSRCCNKPIITSKDCSHEICSKCLMKIDQDMKIK